MSFSHRTTALLLAVLALGACRASGEWGDPLVRLETAGGTELGVSTDYGVVFLGTNARSGPVEILAYFPDGPSYESGVIEPVGGGLYTTEAEIRLPAVPLSFDVPPPGTWVTITGRHGGERWTAEAQIATDPRVDGLLLLPTGALDRLDGSQTGAAVLIGEPGARRLLGLVAGRLQLTSNDGLRRYLTVYGPAEMWRLVTHRRNIGSRPRWVYREDVL